VANVFGNSSSNFGLTVNAGGKFTTCIELTVGLLQFRLMKLTCILFSDPAQIVIRPNQTTTVDAGNTITFVCVAYGNPNPSISWNRGDTLLSNDSRVTIYEELVTENGVTFVQSILELCSAEVADGGQYSCFVDNTLGNDTESFELTVNATSMLQVIIY